MELILPPVFNCKPGAQCLLGWKHNDMLTIEIEKMMPYREQ